MINKIIHFSVYHRAIVLMLTAVIAVIGLYSFNNLPIDAVPDITNNQVQINTSVNGLIPEEIERSITFPIETAMSGIAHVEQVRSITRFGLSQVTVVFDDDIDIYRARQLVAERLASVSTSLPEGIVPKLGPVSSGLGEIFHYAVEAEKPAPPGDERVRQLMELKAVQEWYVKPRLLTVKGVAEVNTIGGYEKQYHVQPNIKLMARFGVHFDDLKEALQGANKNVGGGYIEQTAEQFLVQAKGLFADIQAIKDTPIKTLETFRTVTVGDVAQVELATDLRTGAGLVRGEESVIGTAMMLLGENSRTVSLRVAERLKEIEKGLPEGIKLEVLYDRSTLVNSTINTVLKNLFTGAALVILVLILLLGNLRAAVITAIVIPLSLFFTFILMRWFNISGNLMSLGALDFGIIVDGAVIVLDNCIRRIHDRAKSLKRNLSAAELKETVYEAAVQIRTAAGFGEIIIIVVFLPIFALVGIEGKMFTPMAAAFCFAVLGALIFSFTTVPALASLVLTGAVTDKEPKLMTWLQRIYTPLLSQALKKPLVVISFGIISAVIGLLLFLRLGGEFLPQLDERSLAIQMVRPVNISLSQSVALQEKSEKLISTFPEVKTVFSRVGTPEVATDPMGVNLSDTFITFKPKKDWPEINGEKRTTEALTDAILDRLNEEIPGQNYLVTQPIQMRFNELLEGTRADVTVKVYGDDMDQLQQITREMAEIIEKVPGAGDVELELRGTSPLLQILPNQDMLKRLGVSTAEILETVGIALAGEEAGYMYEGMRRFPIVIRMDEEKRSDLDQIRELPVGITQNATVPLSSAAEVKFTEAYNSIMREQSKRRAAVMINPRGRDTESFVNEAQARIEEAIKFPPGYYAEWGGNFKNLEEARSRLLILTPIALALVLLMIYSAFRSVSETLLVFSCVPLALVGGVLGLTLNDLPFSISAGVGFIALSGIAVLNGVVLVNHINDLHKRGFKGTELVITATSTRLRPVLMTALVAIFGFLPMMISTGVGAEVQRPLASVVVGGIISSTLLTLIVLPALYFVFEKHFQKVETHD
jgi:cobalt-zinc-cadmium resistance protein CzcA